MIKILFFLIVTWMGIEHWVRSEVIAEQPAQSSTDSDSEFVTIFDGTSLSGWHVEPTSEASAWQARDGVIVGTGTAKRSYLVWHDSELADFEIRLDYRFPGQGNSGISIRAQHDETGTRGFKSYHADLGHVGIGSHILGAWDFHTPGRIEHGCSRGKRLIVNQDDSATWTSIEDAVTLDDIRRHDWNSVRVIAKGNHFRFFINGKRSSEFIEHIDPDRRLKGGMLQLQLHDPGMVVHFRDIRLKVYDRDGS